MDSTAINEQTLPKVDETVKSEKPFLETFDHGKIEYLVQRVLLCESRIVYSTSPSNHIFFSTDDLNFKINAFQQAEKPFDFSTPIQATSVNEFRKSIHKGKSVCQTFQLKLLAIPDAEVIQIDLWGQQQDLLVEEKLNLNLKTTYDQLAEDVKTELAKELAIFILNTGASDIASNDLPLIKSKKPKVGLLHLGEMNSVYMGLFGGYKQWGLVHLFPLQKDAIFNEIEKALNISISNLSFEEHIQPNFDSFPKSKTKLIEIAHELYKGITLKKRCDSILDDQKNINTFFVNISREPFLRITKLNLDTNKICSDFLCTVEGEKEYNDATFLGIVTNEFIKLELIKGVTIRNGHGWILAL